MSTGALICDGEVAIAGDGAPLCSGAWMLVPVPQPFSVSQLDPMQMGQAFATGFGLILTVWATARGVKAILDAVKPYFPH